MILGVDANCHSTSENNSLLVSYPCLNLYQNQSAYVQYNYFGSSSVCMSWWVSLWSESFSRRNLSMLILSYPSLIFNTKTVVFPSLDLQNLLMLNIYSGFSPVCMSLLVSLCSESQCKIYQCWFRSILYYHTLTFNPENVVFPSLDLRKGIVYPKAFVVQQLRHS